jgi:PAS domain S-box-containing protein
MSLSTRLTAAMVLLVAFTAAAVGFLSYRNIEAIVIPSELTRLDARARLQSEILNSHIAMARSDVLAGIGPAALEGYAAARLAGGIHPQDHTAESVWRARLVTNFGAELAVNPEYAQLRLIGIANGGRELIRVDRSGPNGAIRDVPVDTLQPKGDRRYFLDTATLAKGSVHVSDIDFDQENGVVPASHAPVARVAAPVFAADGTRFGILIVNIDMRATLASIAASAVAGGDVYIVNRDGDYLLNPDSSRILGFKPGQHYRLQEDFPALASAMNSDAGFQGTIATPSGQSVAAAMISESLAGGPRISIMETRPIETILASAGGVRRAMLLGGLLAVAAAIVLAVLLARSLARPLKEMTASLSTFTGDEDVQMPRAATGEFGTLASAFTRMAKTVREKTAALQDEIATRRRIEDRERLYAAAVKSASDAIVTTTVGGIITTWNASAQRLFGYAAGEAIGQPIALVATPEKRAEQIHHAELIRRGEHIEDFETIRRTKDGTEIDVALTFSPIMDANGAPIGASAIYRDIGPRKHAEKLLKDRAEELQRSNAELEQFAYVASHDLQEPLRMVASYAELLAERYQGKLDAKADKYIGYAVDGAKRMQRLVNDLLLFSRAGRHEPKVQSIDCNTLVADVLKGLDRAVTASGAKIEVSPLPAVVTDAVQMSQVFQNLIGNAIKFRGGKAPLIKISAGRRGADWLFSVADNGIGIEEQYSERIFQMFQRLHDRSSYEGNGIGLPIAKKIVERHGGRIWFESTPGEGTTFHFTIPQRQEKAA